MASKKTNSIMNTGNARMPLRAFQPFQLRQGSPARKSPSSSPTPRAAGDSRLNVKSRWSEHRTSPDRSERKSPNSPSIKVANRRSPSPSIRRTSSVDTIAVPYLTGQWPRDFITAPYQQHGMRDKTTQTPDWSNELSNQQLLQQSVPIISSVKNPRSTPLIEQDLVPQMRKQLRTNAKRSSDKKERSPPVHADHSALYQLPTPLTRSNPISISAQVFGKIPRRQNSIEGFSKEIIDMFVSSAVGAPEPRYIQGLTPPDGHRAPWPRTSSTRTMETQTPQGRSGFDSLKEDSDNVVVIPPRSPPASPVEQHHPVVASNMLRASQDADFKDPGISPCPKYASSPGLNKSYNFQREPPEGAENVKPFKEQDAQIPCFPSCPDIKKNNFFKSTSSAFSPLPCKLIQRLSVANLGSDQGITNQHPSINLYPVGVNNTNNNAENVNRSPLSTLCTTIDA